MNAAGAESHALVQHWSHTNTAFWDVYGVPVYIGTRSQLDAMGQKNVADVMWADCVEGKHRYTTGNSLSGPHPSAYPYTIDVLTAGPSKCGEHGKWSAKDDQITLIHEVLELLVDPKRPEHYRRVNGHIAEVCDYVGRYSRYDQTDQSWIQISSTRRSSNEARHLMTTSVTRRRRCPTEPPAPLRGSSDHERVIVSGSDRGAADADRRRIRSRYRPRSSRTQKTGSTLQTERLEAPRLHIRSQVRSAVRGQRHGRISPNQGCVTRAWPELHSRTITAPSSNNHRH